MGFGVCIDLKFVSGDRQVRDATTTTNTSLVVVIVVLELLLGLYIDLSYLPSAVSVRYAVRSGRCLRQTIDWFVTNCRI